MALGLVTLKYLCCRLLDILSVYLRTGSPPVEGGAPHLSVMALQVLLTSIIAVGAVVGAVKEFTC